jgi:hypothetical protein
MGPFELAKLGSDKSPMATTTAMNEVENGAGGRLVSRHQRAVEALESQRIADEAVLARFGKKQQLTVSIRLQPAVN